MLTKQGMEELKPPVWPWGRLVVIQCTKSPDVVNKTAELLAEVGHDEQGKQLKGQWCIVSHYCLLLLCGTYNEQKKIGIILLWHSQSGCYFT